MSRFYPPHWAAVRMDEGCAMVTDGTHHSPPNTDEGAYRYVTAKNLRPWGLDLSHITYVTEEIHNEIFARCPVEHEDVLYIKDGVTTGLAVVNHLEEPFSLLSSVALFKPYRNILDPYFLKHWLNSPETFKELTGQMSGSAIRRIVLRQLRSAVAPLPPLNEQRRIVAKIEDLTARSQAAKQALDAIPPLLERFRQSVLAAAFRGDLTKQWRQQNPNVEPATELLKRIRQERRHRWEQDYLAQQKAKGKTPKDDKWKEKYQEPEPIDTTGLPELPEGWCWCSAQELCTTSITKGTTPEGTTMSGERGDVPYIKVYNLTMRGELDFSINPTYVDRVTHATKLSRSRVFPGDVLMNIVGPPLGKVSVVPDLFPEWNTNQAVAIFRVASEVSKSYLAYRLLSQEALVWLRGQSRATSGQFNVSLADCRNIPVPLAPPLEQREIVELVNESFGIIDRVESGRARILGRIDTLDSSILAKAFRGKLVSQDPNDEPASVLLERIRAERGAKSPGENGKKAERACEIDDVRAYL